MNNEERDEQLSRTIVGFDVRESPAGIDASQIRKLSILSSDAQGIGSTWQPSFSREVWKKGLAADFQVRENNINLFHIPDFFGEKQFEGSHTCIAAFDVPERFLNAFYPEILDAKIPLFTIMANVDWTFLGYDVADLFHQCSGLFEMDLSQEENAQLEPVKFNGLNLIINLHEASEVSQKLDTLRPENAPFGPCGVWIKLVK